MALTGQPNRKSNAVFCCCNPASRLPVQTAQPAQRSHVSIALQLATIATCFFKFSFKSRRWAAPCHPLWRVCSLTPRSSGPPTAWCASHQTQGRRPNLRLLSSAPHCWGPLNSNVRHRKTNLATRPTLHLARLHSRRLCNRGLCRSPASGRNR